MTTLSEWYDLRNQTIYDYFIKFGKKEMIQNLFEHSTSKHLEQLYDRIQGL